jgi:hypothetical protein
VLAGVGNGMPMGSFYLSTGGMLGGGPAFDAGPRPRSMALGDVNGDGLLDAAIGSDDGTVVIAVAVPGTSTLQISKVMTPQGLSSVALADTDGNGRADLLVANAPMGAVLLFLNVTH